MRCWRPGCGGVGAGNVKSMGNAGFRMAIFYPYVLSVVHLFFRFKYPSVPGLQQGVLGIVGSQGFQPYYVIPHFFPTLRSCCRAQFLRCAGKGFRAALDVRQVLLQGAGRAHGAMAARMASHCTLLRPWRGGGDTPSSARWTRHRARRLRRLGKR